MEASHSASHQTQVQNRKSRLPSKRTLYLLILGVLLLAYTAFVWYLERIDPSVFKLSFPINDPLELLLQFLDVLVRLLRHYVPVLLGWMLAYELALNLVLNLFDLPDRKKAGNFLRRLRDPRLAAGKAITVSPQDLEAKRLESTRH